MKLKSVNRVRNFLHALVAARHALFSALLLVSLTRHRYRSTMFFATRPAHRVFRSDDVLPPLHVRAL